MTNADIVIPMNWEDIDWMLPDNRYALKHLIRQAGVRSVLEIGAFLGGSTLWFLEHVDHVTSIDPWYETAKVMAHNNLLLTLAAYGLPLDFYHVWEDRIRRAGMLDRCRPIRGASQDPAIAAQVPDGSVDLLYIDGDHGYEPCLADIDMYSPKVRTGGVVCGDDFTDRISTQVREAVNERLPQRRIRGQFWWTIKE